MEANITPVNKKSVIIFIIKLSRKCRREQNIFWVYLLFITSSVLENSML